MGEISTVLLAYALSVFVATVEICQRAFFLANSVHFVSPKWQMTAKNMNGNYKAVIFAISCTVRKYASVGAISNEFLCVQSESDVGWFRSFWSFIRSRTKRARTREGDRWREKGGQGKRKTARNKEQERETKGNEL